MLINSKPIFQFKSVKARLTLWSYALIMSGVLVFSFLVYNYLENSKKEDVSEKLKIVRDLKVEQINNWINECTIDFHDLSNDYDVRALEEFNRSGDKKDEKNFKKTRDLLNRYLDNHKSFFEISVISMHTGETLISTNKINEGENHSGDAFFTEPLKTTKLFISDIYYSKKDNKPIMDFSIPIYGFENNGVNIFGVITAKINLEKSLYNILNTNRGIGKTEETYIINKNSMAINDLRWYKNASLNLKIKSLDAIGAISGKSGIMETDDYRGESVISAYTYIPQLGWGLIEKQDISEGYEPIRNISIQFIVNILLFSLFVYFAVNYHSNIISQPLIKMTDVSSKIESGDFTARNHINRPDEFGQLAKSFDKMADSLTVQMKIQQINTELAELMLRLTNVSDFSYQIIKKLVEVTDSCFGAFYIKDNINNEFKHLTSIGLNPLLVKSFDLNILEGELGKIITSNSITKIKDISKDTLFRYKTVAGEIIPKEIVNIPILVENNLEAFISLGNIHNYSSENMGLLKQMNPALDTAFSNLLANEKIKTLANELQTKNQEITSANEELQLQSEELRQQTEELKEQTKELEDQQIKVAEANRLKSEFLSNMSHELRTPLTSILGLSQIMISHGTGKNIEQDKKYLKIVERNGTQLLNLINDILDLSKIEADRMEVYLSEFKPHEIVNRILETIRPMVENKHLYLKAQFDDVPTMYSDEDRVVQILLNIIYNAVKFTEQGGISIKMSSSDGMIIFSIIDTGIGIDQKDLSVIFDEFRQVDGSTTRKYGGTGLGLAISLKIARLLKGDIVVQSSKGHGSTFNLILPLRYKTIEGIMEKQATHFVKSVTEYKEAKTKRTILVVDDNEIAALQINSALSENGFNVDVATGGTEAIEYFKNIIPDAIILDLMMPEIDGFQVLRQVRANESTSKIPVLVLTAKELTLSDRQSLKYNNVNELVQKGTLNREQLVDCIKNLLKIDNSYHVQKKLKNEDKLILIVEDNPDNLLIVSTILKEFGYDFISTMDGNEAIKIARKNMPGIILMDIQLPGISGLEVTKIIKYDNTMKDIPIIAMTAKAMKGDRENILAAGCDDYISKPINPLELKKIIDKWGV
ncbi:response regulator [Candidatus Poribacteria bacterium]|nr:response regulator [Candidatus Poribacteria bacterium]